MLIDKLKAEKEDLDIKISKLRKDLEERTCDYWDQYLMNKQLTAMLDYSFALGVRINHLMEGQQD